MDKVELHSQVLSEMHELYERKSPDICTIIK